MRPALRPTRELVTSSDDSRDPHRSWIPGSPDMMPRSEIQAIRWVVAGSVKAGARLFIKCGDRVRVREGPLMGVEGILFRKKSQWKFVLSLVVLERSAAVEHDRRRHEMSAVMDDIARIIARPIPRRQALRLVGGVVGGTIAAALGKAKGLGSWAAQVGGASVATSPKCGRGQFACGTGSRAVCCSSGTTCCGNTTVGFTCCGSSQGCCTDAKTAYCAPPRSTCCKGASCGSTQSCCNGKCCDKLSHQTCCGTTSSGVCCSSGQVCCGGRCCKSGPSASNPCTSARC